MDTPDTPFDKAIASREYEQNNKECLALINAKIDQMMDLLSSLHSQFQDMQKLIGPFAVPMPDGEMLVQSIFGIKYLIDPSDMVMAPNLIIYRQWEASLSRLVNSLVDHDSTFVDVGANFGYYTCLIGTRIGTKGKGRVFAFEPNPNLYHLLEKNIQINWSMSPIHLSNCALGEGPSRLATLHIPKTACANATLINDSINLAGSSIKVELSSLDSKIPPGTKVNLMKIDVEGHEYYVLAGAERVINESPDIIIIMEWSQKQMKAAGVNTADIYDMFGRLSLKPYSMPDDDSQLADKKSLLTRDYLDALDYGEIILLKA